MNFASKEHHDFYHELTEELNADCYLRALIYAVGICHDTRSRWQRFYDADRREIKPEVINESWQTGSTARLTRLALQLYTDGTPTAVSFDAHDNPIEDFKECRQFSVSDIFCCSFAPYFMEAVKLRYPEYFNGRV